MQDNIKAILEQLNDDEFLLPVGYTDAEGVLHRRVKLTPMTGESEEMMADAKVRDNAGKMITELLFSIVEELGTVKKVNKEVIRELSTKDRDFLLLKNAQVSIGDEISFVDQCPHCKGKNEIVIDIAGIEVKYLDDGEPREFTFDLPNGYKDRDGKVHKTITVKLPNGRVQERIASVLRVNPAQAVSMMLQLITKKLGTLDFINPEVFKKMTKKDRDFISKQLDAVEVGVSFNIETVCSNCGAEYTTSIPLANLLGE